jgi:hypothetical protein
MSAPVAPGRALPPSSPPNEPAGGQRRTQGPTFAEHMRRMAEMRGQAEPQDGRQRPDARDAPTTPGHMLPVVDRSKVDPRIRQAAEGWEAMFLDYMMKTMRQTVPKNEMDLESPATEIYRGMMDSEMAQRAVKAGGVGLADQMIAYLQAQSYTLPRGSEAASSAAPQASHGDGTSGRDTGGIHAGRTNRN